MAIKKTDIIPGMTVICKDSPTGRRDVEWEVIGESEEVKDAYILERIVDGERVTRHGNWRNMSLPDEVTDEGSAVSEVEAVEVSDEG